MQQSKRKSYVEPLVERVPLVAEEAVLFNCKCVSPQIDGPISGWCSGYSQVSCSSVGS